MQQLFIKFITEKEINLVENIKFSSKEVEAKHLYNMFMDGILPVNLWDHYGRLKIAHCYILKHGINSITASQNKETSLEYYWKRYLKNIGHENRWNCSLTYFWAKILWNTIRKYPTYSYTFDLLYLKESLLGINKLHLQYYSMGLLYSNIAKQIWVEPDLKNLL